MLNAVEKIQQGRLWDQLMLYAATLQPQIRDAFLQSVRAVLDAAGLEQLTKLLDDGDYAGVEELLAGARVYDLILPALQSALLDSATTATTEIGSLLRVAMGFDAYNPLTVQTAQQSAGLLIRQIENDARASVRAVIVDALQQGTPPAETARALRQFIGLTDGQRRAVMNYRTALETNDFRNAIGRELADGRSDRRLQRLAESSRRLADRTALPQADIDRLVDRYATRYRNYRAVAIARTESINALSVGNRLAWEQAVETGRIHADQVVRRWFVGDAPCPVCAPIPRLNPDGVGLRDAFATPIGPVMDPTVHPNCLCVVFVRPR